MPRKKKFENRHFPIGLTQRKLRGVKRFRYRKPNGKDFLFPIGTLEIDAIEAAIIFNQKHRNPMIKLLMEHDPYNKPLTQWVDVIIERVRKEELEAERINEDSFKAFLLDMARLKTLHGEVPTKTINLDHVNSYLETYAKGKSSGVYNRKISFLKKVFSYLLDDGAMTFNPAENKKKKPTPDKIRIRLSLEKYKQLLNQTPHSLNIAMRLSLQTTHAVNELSVAKYKDCRWFDKPMVENDLLVYGLMRIRRQKVQKKEASRVEIPITQKIKDIIDDSRKDNIVSPYIIHQLKSRKSKLAKGLTHHTQLRSKTISKLFSKFRDKLGLYDNIEMDERPTFHEIRSLSIHMYKKSGIDPQERAAHTDAKTTKKYAEGHVKWVQILAAELPI